MHVIRVRNVNDALPEAVDMVLNKPKLFVQQDSRAGKVYRCLEPVTTVYESPRERVMFHTQRDCNPFFHFMEGLWMLAGRKDVAWISQFNKSFVQFSDNGEDFHGAYGHRWRRYWEAPNGGLIDQIETVILLLQKDPLDRRCVIQMWNPSDDLGQEGKDFPCNTTIFVSVSGTGCLDMQVNCRSNDIVWGAYGANAVHMSMLQEYIAAGVGVPVGTYWQSSYNWHAYENTFAKVKGLAMHLEDDPYIRGIVAPFDMISTDLATWMQDLHMFIEEGPVIGFRDPFFRRVATPLYHSWMAYSDKEDPYRHGKAFEIIGQCAATDWRLACIEWLERRASNADAD